jgi:peptidoglycan/LPS O-acetylase OafA/YrhL
MHVAKFDAGHATSKMVCFEAIRGLAALAVLVGHFILGFWPGMAFREGLGWNELPGAVRMLADFPGKYLWDGHMAVSIFFVLSGFVLSLIYFQRGGTAAIGSAAVRRYPRLMIPIAASILLAFVLLKVGAMCNQAAVQHMNALYGLPQQLDLTARNGYSNRWLALYFFNPPDVAIALREATWGAVTGIATYNLILWTMPFELVGSFLVYGSLALFGAARNRWLLYAIGGGLLIADDRLFLLDFLLGMALCDMWVQNQRKWGMTLSLWPALALIALGLYVVPWKPVAALMVVSAAAASPRLQQLLEARWLAFLGRISFSLYLLHMIVFCSVGCGLYVLLCRDLGWSHAAGSLTAAAGALVVCLLAAWLFYHTVDRTAITLSRRFDVWLFRPRAKDETTPAVLMLPLVQQRAA